MSDLMYRLAPYSFHVGDTLSLHNTDGECICSFQVVSVKKKHWWHRARQSTVEVQVDTARPVKGRP